MPSHSYLHMLPPTWKYLQANYVSFCIELQETLQPEPQHYTAHVLLGVCWPQGLVPICPILQQGSSGNLKGTQQRHEDRRAASNVKENFSLKHKDSLAMERDHIFKSKTSATKNQPCGVETAEWKIQSQAQYHLKISKRVFLKLLLHKSSWDRVLSSFNTPLFAGDFLKAIR